MGAGKPIVILSNFQPAVVALSFSTNGFRAHSRPGIELSRLLAQHHEFDVSAADIDDERFLFMTEPAAAWCEI